MMTAQQRFSERADSLWKLGFTNYGAYLASPMWRAIRAGVIARARSKCQCCGDGARQVHHRSYDYETMRGRRLDQLVALCPVCHDAAERDLLNPDAALKMWQDEVKPKVKSNPFARSMAIEHSRWRQKGTSIGRVRPPLWRRKR